MTQLRKFCLAAAALMGLAPTLAGTAHADVVVIRAVGPGVTVGQSLAAGASVSLPAGSNATLLFQDGKTVTLTGPFTGVPEAKGAAAGGGDPKVVAALSRLLTTGASDRGTMGVTRSVMVDPYAIDRAGGTHCQTSDHPVEFKRGMALGVERITLVTAAGSESVVTWADGSSAAPWPKELPFADGTYLLRTEGRPNPTKLVVRRVPDYVRGSAAVAAWMADHGCKRQALALLNSLQ